MSLVADVSVENSPHAHVVDLAAKDFSAPDTSEKESKSFPIIIRFNVSAADEAEQTFHSAFVAARVSFQKNLSASFLLESLFRDRKLDATALASDRFAQVIRSFQNQNISFPLTRNLAELWATGASDDALESAWAEQVRSAMGHYILSSAVSFDAAMMSRALLVSVTNQTETIDLESLAERGKKVSELDFTTFAKVKSELQGTFSEKEKSVAEFLGSFLEENCVCDGESVQRIFGPKKEEAAKIATAIVLPKKMVAKSEEVKTAALPTAPVPVKSSNLPKIAAPSVFAKTGSSNGIFMGGVAIAALVLLSGWILRRKFKRKETQSLPVIASENTHQVPVVLEIPKDDEDEEIQFWRGRALEAELRLERASAKTKSHLLPHLARLLMNQFVQRLLSQRTGLLDTQEMAALKVVEMEKCLEKIHASRENQLQAYQLRIERLEKELAEKHEENRELLRATIQLTEAKLNRPETSTRQTNWN